MFPVLDLYYTDPLHHVITAGYDLLIKDDLDRVIYLIYLSDVQKCLKFLRAGSSVPPQIVSATNAARISQSNVT